MRGLSENRLRGDSILRSSIPTMEKMDQKSYWSAAHEFLNAIPELILFDAIGDWGTSIQFWKLAEV